MGSAPLSGRGPPQERTIHGPAAIVAVRRERTRLKNLVGHRTFTLYMLPSVIVLFAVTLLPMVYLVVTSFTPFDLTKPGSLRFVGLHNYVTAFAEERFWNSVWVQARLSFWTVSFQLIIGLGLAWLLSRQVHFIELVRSLFIIPMVLPPVVVAIIWKILFTPDISILNWLLEKIGLPQPPWLADPTRALWALIITDTWEWFPFVLLFLLAAIQMLPVEPMEAARIDGCSEWQLFCYVTLPCLKPAIMVAGLFRLIDSLKAFPHIFILTGGGPGKVTEATNFFAYLNAYSYGYIGFSSAIVVLMVIVVFAMSFLLIRLVLIRVEVE